MQKVKSGDPLKIPAAAYNSFIDAARDYQFRARNRQSAVKRPLPPGNLAYIKNDTAVNCQRFNILGVNSVLTLPSDNLQAFKNGTVLNGIKPAKLDHSGGRIAILNEPIPAGRIGRAYVSGVCPVQIDMISESHRTAEVKEMQAEHLQSSDHGSLGILWAEPGTGLKWSLVRFGAGGGGSATAMFKLAEVSGNPMSGYEVYDYWAGSWSTSAEDIYVFPQIDLTHYRIDDFIFAAKVGGVWFAHYSQPCAFEPYVV